jgi:hypothetical protein
MKLLVLPSGETPAIKYLGVYFDPNLNFKFHVQNISKKLSRALFQIRRVRNILSEKALKTLYYSFCHCHINYAMEIWNCAAKNLLNELFLKQKTAVLIILNSKYNSHTAPIFKKLNILPLQQLSQFNLSKIMYYYKHNLLPSCHNNTWLTVGALNQERGGPALRDAEELVIPFARTEQLSRFPELIVLVLFIPKSARYPALLL